MLLHLHVLAPSKFKWKQCPSTRKKGSSTFWTWKVEWIHSNCNQIFTWLNHIAIVLHEKLICSIQTTEYEQSRNFLNPDCIPLELPSFSDPLLYIMGKCPADQPFRRMTWLFKQGCRRTTSSHFILSPLDPMGRIPVGQNLLPVFSSPASDSSNGISNSPFCWHVQTQEQTKPCTVTIPNLPDKAN